MIAWYASQLMVSFAGTNVGLSLVNTTLAIGLGNPRLLHLSALFDALL
jgi:hypothetical protein